MARRYINELTEQTSVNEIYRVTNKQLRPNRNGDLYLQVDLSDKTGTITARLWNVHETIYQSFENGDYIRVEGKAQVFQGSMQVIAKKIFRVPESEVEEEDFIQVSGVQVDKLVLKMTEMLRHLEEPALTNLAECYLMDQEFMEKFTTAPAGVRHHHAYLGGLLEHVTTMMEVARRVGDCYSYLNTDLVVMGAFLHDTGKVAELQFDGELSYTNEGQLLGHMFLGLSMLEKKIQEAESLSGEPFPSELALRLKHLLASHHGEYEFGSPKLPMTLEALALHCIDLLDSKLAAFEQILREDLNTASPWTTFQPSLQRKLFKGS
ncbi:MAG: OB-fold nucleic acid binding domain-containing protein [Planctomycetia bacterium]|nr:OB-fold nucleic acid binding domain-containing protein [Planctomycetia bacterium]